MEELKSGKIGTIQYIAEINCNLTTRKINRKIQHEKKEKIFYVEEDGNCTIRRVEDCFILMPDGI